MSESNLIQSYVRRRWFVSTALRESSAFGMSDCTYYETWAWPIDPSTRKKADQSPEGIRAFLCHGKYTADKALDQHVAVCRSLLAKCPECVADHYE